MSRSFDPERFFNIVMIIASTIVILPAALWFAVWAFVNIGRLIWD